jgi:hypothetical protein
MSMTRELMTNLLQRFDDLFATPSGLPPLQARSHQIRLLPGAGDTRLAMLDYHLLHSRPQGGFHGARS